MQSRAKWTQGYSWGRDTTSTEREDKKTLISSHLNLQNKTTRSSDPNFTSSYNWQSLTLRTPKISRLSSVLAGGRQETESSPLKRHHNKQQRRDTERYSIEAAIWKIPGLYRREICLLITEHVLEGQGSLGEFSRNKGAGEHNFLSPSSSLDTWIPAVTSEALIFHK